SFIGASGAMPLPARLALDTARGCRRLSCWRARSWAALAILDKAACPEPVTSTKPAKCEFLSSSVRTLTPIRGSIWCRVRRTIFPAEEHQHGREGQPARGLVGQEPRRHRSRSRSPRGNLQREGP